MNETAYPPPPPGHFLATVSMIHSGRFFHAGQPMPLSELEKIPSNLRKPRYLKFHDSRTASFNGDGPQNLIFELGQNYPLDAEGRRHSRDIQRQINLEQMRLEAEEQLEQQVKDEIEHPDEQIKTAMQIAKEQYEAAVSKEIASQSYRAKEQEFADAAAREMIEEEDRQAADIGDINHQITPTLSAEEPAPETEEWSPQQPKPRRMRKRYVRRGTVWMRTKQIKHFRIGEQVYVKNKTGAFEPIGVVNKHGRPPACYVEDQTS